MNGSAVTHLHTVVAHHDRHIPLHAGLFFGEWLLGEREGDAQHSDPAILDLVGTRAHDRRVDVADIDVFAVEAGLFLGLGNGAVKTCSA
jgi:hypothetical protein